MADVIRTSFIMEGFQVAIRKSGAELKEKLTQLNVTALHDSLFFDRRKEVFTSLDKIINSAIESDTSPFEEIIPEYLFYSNIGRSDLIRFEVFVDKFRSANQAEFVLDNFIVD